MKKIVPLDDYNGQIHCGTDIVGAVTTTWGHSALRNGWKLIEIYEKDNKISPRMEQGRDI